jgi:hypothetical protein
MLFKAKDNTVNLSKPRTGSSVPAIAQRRNDTLRSPDTVNTQAPTYAVNIRNPSRYNTTTNIYCASVHAQEQTRELNINFAMFLCAHTEEGVCGHRQYGQPGQVAQWFECTCDHRTNTNATQLIANRNLEGTSVMPSC